MRSGKHDEQRKDRKKAWCIAICAVLILGSAVAIRMLWQADDASAPAETEPEPEAAENTALPEEPEISDARYPTVLSNGQSFGLRPFPDGI